MLYLSSDSHQELYAIAIEGKFGGENVWGQFTPFKRLVERVSDQPKDY